MSELSDRYRAIIETKPAGEARDMVLRLIRRIARHRVYEYGIEHFITDFQDPVLVTDRHRTFRADVVTQASTRAAAANAASSMAELLVVFDDIAELIV
jgi:hypothetical protein